jgi:hypothetical protein
MDIDRNVNVNFVMYILVIYRMKISQPEDH